MASEHLAIPYGRGGGHIDAWLHPAVSRTLVLLLHGHNTTGDRPRFVTLADTIQQAGFACLRFSVYRKKLGENEYEVSTVSEEVRQAHVILEHFAPEYDAIIVAGHSQGGIAALAIAEHLKVRGIVQIMAVADTNDNAKGKLEKIGAQLDGKTDRLGSMQDGTSTFVYTKAFFDDLVIWDVPRMLQSTKPKLFIAGEQDESITQPEVEHAYATAQPPKELLIVNDAHRFSLSTAVHIGESIVAWITSNNLC